MNRIIRVATVSQDGLSWAGPATHPATGKRIEPTEFIDETFERLDQAASDQPDIVCLPEVFPRIPCDMPSGKIVERVSNWAKAHRCYVVCPVYTQTNGCTHNSALLIDRGGNVLGQYNKIHPTENELSRGIRPGATGPRVFETDFGVVGIQICFDINWHDSWRELKAKGAELVFYPAAYPAERQLSALAWMNEYFIVSSTTGRPASIFDISGEIIDQSGRFRPWAKAALPLDKKLFELDSPNIDQVPGIERKYGRRVEITWYHNEDWFTLASLDPELAVSDIIAEFGLITKRDYHARSYQKQEAARHAAVAAKM